MPIDAQTLISRMEWAAAQGLTEFMFHDGRISGAHENDKRLKAADVTW